VPPPILTRVFQELGAGLVHFHTTLQCVIWPFPFPYAQMSLMLILIYCVFTPIMLCQWTSNEFTTAFLTLISVVFIKGIDLTAVELENPFGEDPNDLPMFELHHEMVQDLILIANPETMKLPRLTEQVKMDHKRLSLSGRDYIVSLQQYQKQQSSTSILTSGINAKNKITKGQKQMFWAKQVWPESGKRITRYLSLVHDDHEMICNSQQLEPYSSGTGYTEETDPHEFAAGTVQHVPHSLCKRTSNPDSKEGSQPTPHEPPWHEFLSDFSDRMQQNFNRWIEQHEAACQRQVAAIEQALTRALQQP